MSVRGRRNAIQLPIVACQCEFYVNTIQLSVPSMKRNGFELNAVWGRLMGGGKESKVQGTPNTFMYR